MFYTATLSMTDALPLLVCGVKVFPERFLQKADPANKAHNTLVYKWSNRTIQLSATTAITLGLSAMQQVAGMYQQ